MNDILHVKKMNFPAKLNIAHKICLLLCAYTHDSLLHNLLPIFGELNEKNVLY